MQNPTNLLLREGNAPQGRARLVPCPAVRAVGALFVETHAALCP